MKDFDKIPSLVFVSDSNSCNSYDNSEIQRWSPVSIFDNCCATVCDGRDLLHKLSLKRNTS